MNEVTKINLGRQVFTIAADAQYDLKVYLDAIKKEVSDKDVVEEVELRMAELLGEQGINEDKVVLKKDVDYLKEQLGSPKEFKEEEGEDEEEPSQPKFVTGKRLFRDTDNAILAGVASGLASYFGLDVLLVRFLFIFLLVITFGWGVLIYILLWLLVPEAKTASDRLQMAGKPVTVKGIRTVAKDADVKGAAKRVNTTIADSINRVFAICLKIFGVLMAASGLSIIFGLIAGLIYFFAKQDVWYKYNIFPIGTDEHIVLYLGMFIAAVCAIFVILFGVAIFRRKWPIHVWVTGTLVGILLLSMAVFGALGASVFPNVRDAYNANLHTTTRTLKPFNTVNASAGNIWEINYEYASTYYVTINYFGNPNLANVKTSVGNNTLNINTEGFDWHRTCPVLCLPYSYNLNITIHSPNFSQLENNQVISNKPYIFEPNHPMKPFMY